MKNNKKSGYIILLTLIIISTCVIMITYLYTRSSIYIPYLSTMANREKAKMLALSGIQIAMSQIDLPEINTKIKSETKPLTPDEQAKQLLTNLLPIINQWQIFPLKETTDGIDGQIKIAISSEEGKIDINKIFDFKKHIFQGENQATGDWKKILQELFKQIQTLTGGNNLFQMFEKFLKQRQNQLQDITELLTIKEFSVFKQAQFYEPSKSEKIKEEKKRPIYLTDIFTVFGKKTIEPWLFSDSLIAILDLKRPEPRDITKRKEKVEKILKTFKLKTNWAQDWNVMLKPLYERELQNLPKGIEFMLNTAFEPTIFSVLSYGTTANVTQRVFAILEREKSSTKDKTVYHVKIKKLYWL